MKDVSPSRVFFKSLVLYGLVNLAFGFVNPPVGRLSIYNWLVPGRERVPYEREVEYYLGAHTIPVFEDMDAMYHSHILSRPKQPDEYRVVLVGDSSTWGFGLRPEDTQAGKITRLNLTTCTGKRIVAYNAAFPLPYVMKDLLIMDNVRAYEPDLYLWFITLDAFRNRTIFTDYFLKPYAERVSALKENYHLNNLDSADLSAPTFWEQTIIGQRSRLKKIALLQIHGFGWNATGLDYLYHDSTGLSQDQSESLLFELYKPGELQLDSLLFDVLDAGYAHAEDTPLLIVNEPIFVAAGKNKELRYNEYYPRWAYDEYVNYLDIFMEDRAYPYINAWDKLPSSEFTDSPFHRTPLGEKLLAELIAPELLDLACK